MMHRSLVLFLAVLLSITVLAIPTRSVESQTSVLYAAESTTGNGDCNSWQNACTLQTALTKANGSGEIWVKAGEHKPGTTRADSFELTGNVELYGGFAGDENYRSERDWEKNQTVLSGDIGEENNTNDKVYHVVSSRTAGSTPLLDGFSITAGNANGALGSGNEAGGGMINTANPTLRNITFMGNSAQYGGGFTSSGSPTLENVYFIFNSATIHGGAIYLSLEGTKTLSKVFFAANTAEANGGAMYIYQNNPTITNGYFYRNSAENGGGLYSVMSDGATLTNVTFSENYAEQGGGLVSQNSNLALKNALLWGNIAISGNDPQIHNSAGVTRIDYSLVQGGCSAGSECTHLITADPLFGPEVRAGSFFLMISLLPGSPAIDAGDPDQDACPASDLRGVERSDPGCDIGAYESRGFNFTVISGDNQSTPINTGFTDPLTVSVSSPYGEPVNDGYVTFSPPADGASATLLTENPVEIVDGVATTGLTANGISGPYTVRAGTANALTEAFFHLTNTRPPTVTTIHSSANPAFTASPLTFTVTVSDVFGVGTPTGEVELVQFVPIGSYQTFDTGTLTQELVDGVAVFTLPSLPAGEHAFFANYLGDTIYGGSRSEPFAQTINLRTVILPVIFR